MYRVKFNESQVLGLDVAIGTRLDAHAGQRAQVVRVKTGSYQACSVIVDDHREQARSYRGLAVFTCSVPDKNQNVGVSLLAMTVLHSASMSPDTAPSRASSAPTGDQRCSPVQCPTKIKMN